MGESIFDPEAILSRDIDPLAVAIANVIASFRRQPGPCDWEGMVRTIRRLKLCVRCRHVYDLDDFYRDRTRRDGHASYCRWCARENVYQARQKRPEHYIAYRKELWRKRRASKKAATAEGATPHGTDQED